MKKKSSKKTKRKPAGRQAALAGEIGSASALWNHMAETHNLHLLESEEADIRHAANAAAEKEIFGLLSEVVRLRQIVIDVHAMVTGTPNLITHIADATSEPFPPNGPRDPRGNNPTP